jgi:hypothetical protein
MITVDKLPSNPEPGVSLHCDGCHSSYSAHQGDYFMLKSGTKMRCGLCGEPLRLVRKVAKLVPVRT